MAPSHRAQHPPQPNIPARSFANISCSSRSCPCSPPGCHQLPSPSSPMFLSLMSPPADILSPYGTQLFAAGWKQEASLSSVRIDTNQSQQGTGQTNWERALYNWKERAKFILILPQTGGWRCARNSACAVVPWLAAAWVFGLGVQSFLQTTGNSVSPPSWKSRRSQCWCYHEGCCKAPVGLFEFTFGGEILC